MPLIARDVATGNVAVVNRSKVWGAAVDPKRLYFDVQKTPSSVAHPPQFALQAEDLRSGHILWSFVGDGSIDSPPIIAGRYLYAASDHGQPYTPDASIGHLYTLDASTGQLLGTVRLPERYPYPDEHTGGMASSAGVLVVSTGQHLSAYVPGPASTPSVTGTTAPSTPATTPVAGGTPATGPACLGSTTGDLCITAVSPNTNDLAKSVKAITVTFSSAVQHGTISVSLYPSYAGSRDITVSNQSFSGVTAVVPLSSIPDRGSYMLVVSASDASGSKAFLRTFITLQ
jgi:hypothetical protein